MSFADSMEDLEAMNDPRNTAESVAARHAAKQKQQSRRFQTLFARLFTLKRKYQAPPER